jgi:transcriptional regulator with XRE-family HTH domain
MIQRRNLKAKDRTRKEEKERDPAARSVGAVISFYRRAKGKTQKKLIEDAQGIISATSLAMIEGGTRLPTEKALRFLCDQLQLSAFQIEQLEDLLHDSERTDEQRLKSIMPSDVLQGRALFLRPPGDDSTLLESAGVEEIWIITKSPLTVKKKYYEMLRERLKSGKLRSTYFVDSDAGKSQFVELYQMLLKDPNLDSDAKNVLSDRLRCIIVPSTLTIFGFVLFNPNIPNRMFGRSVVMDQNGLTVGVIPMDTPKVAAAFREFNKIVERVGTLRIRGSGAREIIQGIGECELVLP